MKFKKWLNKFDENQILYLSEVERLNVKQIAEKLDIPSKRLGEMINYFDLPIKKSFKVWVDDKYFDVIDTAKKAYILGYLIGDGCVLIEPKKKDGNVYSYNKRIAFTCSIDDLPVLTMIRDEICPNVEIKQYLNTKGAVNRKISCRLRWSSSYMVNTLIEKHSIKPKKTYDYSFEYDFTNIPVCFHLDFVNGLFDADGTCTKKTTYISIEMNSEKFANQIGNILKSNEIITNYRIKKHESKTCVWHTLYLLGGKSTKIALSNVFYQKGFGLKRKQEKLNQT